jgi:predicted unusual protein kinase regulating ubiquinone biosynthesis (AarF/ABC1/UbiB family)
VQVRRLFDEFQVMVGRELDYRQEQAYLEEFRRQFAADPRVRVPRSFPRWSTSAVLVMEFVTGAKLTDAPALDAWQIDRQQLAQTLIDTFLAQVLVHGLVQLDPHPGNFLVTADGQLVFLDFGMMGRVPASDLRWAGELIQGALSQDARRVVDALTELGFVQPWASKPLLVRVMQRFLERIQGTPLVPGAQLDRAVEEFQEFLYQEPLAFPAHYMFLGRAIGMLFGLVSQLSPDLDWMSVVKSRALPLIQKTQRQSAPPWLQHSVDWLADGLPESWAQSLAWASAWLWSAGQEWARLPGRMQRVIADVETGTLATRPELTPVLRRLDRQADLLEALYGLIAAGSVLGAGTLWAHELHQLWWQRAAWILAVGLAVWSIGRWRRANRRLRLRRMPPSASEQARD